METNAVRALAAAAAMLAAGAYAQGADAPTPPSNPGDDTVATQRERELGALPERPRGLQLTPRIDLAVGEVPNVRVDPPSNDRRYDPRTRKEWTWQAPQRGTNATGMWPMPGTGGQPGTLQ